MKKVFKWLLAGMLTLAAVLLIVLLLLPRIFDPNDHKQRIETMLTSTIGREVNLNGPIEWQVFPWLALEFRDVVIANDNGFDGAYLARVESLSARLKVAPLLNKQFRIGTVSITGANINLQVARNGDTNWQGIADTLSTEDAADPQDNDATTTDLKVSGIQIDNARISYRDQSTNVSATLEDMSLSSGRIEPGQPVSLELSADISLPETGLQGHVTSRAQLQNLFGKLGVVMVIDALRFEGQWNTGGNPVPLALSLDKPARIVTETARLDFPQVKLTLANAVMQASASGSWQDNGDYQGRLYAKEFDLQSLLSTIGGSPLASTEAMRRFFLDTSWRLRGQRLQLPDLTATLDKTHITGQADLTSLESLTGQFALTLDSLTVDDYLPVESDDTPAVEKVESPTGTLNFGHLNGTVRIADMRAFGVRFGDTELKVQTQGDNLKIVPMRAQFYQGLLNTQVLVNLNAPHDRVKLTSQARDFQVGQLIQDLAGEAWITGLGQLQADIAIDDPLAPSPMKTARGQLSYSLSDGVIYGLDMLATVKQAVTALQSLRQGQEAPASQPKTVSGTATGKDQKTEFASIRFAGNVQQGILTSRELELNTPFLQVRGQVAIDLDALTIKGTLEPMLTSIPQNWMKEQYLKLLNVPIPIRLEGPLAEPGIRIDLAKLLLASQKQRIDEKKKELKKKLLNSLLGADDQAEEKKTNHKQHDTEAEKTGKRGEEKPESDEEKLKKKLLDELFGSDD